ncbi:radical SAM protein [Helicobacter sp. MIT 11-5569]|uniref:radical SAM protein n=1 Tax=Helicobacter sp. MIT 11-5569 TaxID=1548151 RepID=UPI0010FF4AE3|nr:radical SAM protein [Helicobacter sp. MIT 11-5569]TLD84602.1 radical SAM protein [Helicobacter sp. MIT 11-5569]
MTPPILKELFDQWRKEGLSFCVTSENYNKSVDLVENVGVCLSFRYPFEECIESVEYWREENNYRGDPPKFLDENKIDRIASWLIAKNTPKTITLQVTTYCNYECPMCPWHGRGNEFKEEYYKRNPELKQVIMPIDKAKKIIDEIVEYGMEHIGLTPQGEFFLYPHWEELLAYTTQKNIGVSLTTNGSLLTEEVVKKLQNYRVDILSISVDTLDYQVFKKIRSKNEKLFTNTIKAPLLIGNLNTYGQINIVKQEDNKEEIGAILENYHQSDNIKQICVIKEVTYDDRLATQSSNENHPISLCEGFGEYIIQANGNVIGCCFAASYPKILGAGGGGD